METREAIRPPRRPRRFRIFDVLRPIALVVVAALLSLLLVAATGRFAVYVAEQTVSSSR